MRVAQPRTHSEQGMYENSCINLSLSSAPGFPQGSEENNAKEKLNPMSKIRQTQLLLSTRWSPGFGGGGAPGPGGRAGRGGAQEGRVRPALARPSSFPGLCYAVEVRWRGWSEALSMYIYTWLRPPPLGETPVQTFLQGRVIRDSQSHQGNRPCLPSGSCPGCRQGPRRDLHNLVD